MFSALFHFYLPKGNVVFSFVVSLCLICFLFHCKIRGTPFDILYIYLIIVALNGKSGKKKGVGQACALPSIRQPSLGVRNSISFG